MSGTGKVLAIVGAAVGVLVVGAVLAVVIWQVNGRRGLARTLADLRQRGEPLSFAELAPPAVPDSENAATLYEEAFRLLPERGSVEEKHLGDLAIRLRTPTEQDLADAEKTLGKYERALALVREGSTRTACRFTIDYSGDPLEEQSPRRLSDGISDVIKLLKMSAVVNLHRGKADEAALDCATMLRFARSVEEMPSLGGMLEARGLDSAACEELNTILDRADLKKETLEQVSERLPRTYDGSALVRAIRVDRTVFLTTFRQRFPRQAADWMAYDLNKYLTIMGLMEEMAGKPFYQSKREWRRVVLEIDNVPKRCKFTGISLPNMEDMKLYYDETVARKLLAREAIGLRVYRMKTGRYPEKAAELVPEFIEELPVDPFSGKELVYRREGQGFILYSLGWNMKDDGGIEDRDHPEKSDVVWKCSR